MNALVYEELTSRIIAGLRVEQQKTILLTYRETPIGEHRLDLLVEGKIVVELKAISALEDIHFAIVRSYLKAACLEHGLLINFATMPLTVKRVIFQKSNTTVSS